ncbi:putative viral helicase [Candidatus Termititenax persephonae]|uniref:Viral helicase n=1 Tax=Candidatus Termititenax persephonae TaxID=2218525 RepID=A0A388TG33_9BACT|nr:putative viral helicase [Candidatus Termititenax persephonae]
MDKQLILAVAGSGKTNHIINRLNLADNSLIITYTDTNYRVLRDKIIQKFNFFPQNITLFTYFSFLYSFCFNPLLSYEICAKGINFKEKPNQYTRKNTLNHYRDNSNRLYSNRIAKLLKEKNIFPAINQRISKYFDNLFIDEVQDFAGNDFNLLISLLGAKVAILLVGDFYQHTFNTSNDGNVNKDLYNSYDKYIEKLKETGIVIDNTTLNKSYRCSPTTCSLITNKLGIEINSHKTEPTNINIINDFEHAKSILANPIVVKLFYKEHYKYNCYSRNWGDCKGEDKYNDICIVVNKEIYEMLSENSVNNLTPTTKNKLYVALSRANNDVYILPNEYCKKLK